MGAPPLVHGGIREVLFFFSDPRLLRGFLNLP
jgi:hypothetical protein